MPSAGAGGTVRKLSAGAVAGIVIAVLVVVAISCAVVAYVLKRRSYERRITGKRGYELAL
jgi:hypothetical protein